MAYPQSKQWNMKFYWTLRYNRITLSRKENDTSFSLRKKKDLLSSGFSHVGNHRVKKSKNIDKCLDLTRELRKLRNMRVTVIPAVVGVHGMVLEDLEKKANLRYLQVIYCILICTSWSKAKCGAKMDIRRRLTTKWPIILSWNPG